MQRWCKGGRCRGATVQQRSRGAGVVYSCVDIMMLKRERGGAEELQVQRWCRCRGSGCRCRCRCRCRGAEVQRYRGAELQLWRGACAVVQCWYRGVEV